MPHRQHSQRTRRGGPEPAAMVAQCCGDSEDSLLTGDKGNGKGGSLLAGDSGNGSKSSLSEGLSEGLEHCSCFSLIPDGVDCTVAARSKVHLLLAVVGLSTSPAGLLSRNGNQTLDLDSDTDSGSGVSWSCGDALCTLCMVSSGGIERNRDASAWPQRPCIARATYIAHDWREPVKREVTACMQVNHNQGTGTASNGCH